MTARALPLLRPLTFALTCAAFALAPACGDDGGDGGPDPTPQVSPDVTPDGSADPTPVMSADPTPVMTPAMTPMMSPDPTPQPTPVPTGNPDRWELRPGMGVDGFLILGAHAYSDIKARLGGDGTAVENSTFVREYADASLRARFSDVNFNQQLDDTDRLLTVTVFGAYPGQTASGLGVGSTKAEVEGTAGWENPDQVVTLPASNEFPGGTFGFYFTKGALFQYDDADNVTRITITRAYPQAPDATLDFENLTLNFGGAGAVKAGDCDAQSCEGDPQSTYEGILGTPDYTGGLTQEVMTNGQTVNVELDLDFYAVLGIQMTAITKVRVGGAINIDRDAVVAIALFPPFYGKSPEGIGIGSTRTEVETTLGWSNPSTEPFPEGEGNLLVYTTAGGRRIGVSYSNDGASGDDIVLALFIPLPAEAN